MSFFSGIGKAHSLWLWKRKSKRGDLAVALRHLNNAHKFDSTDVKVGLLLAETYLNLTEYSEALRVFNSIPQNVGNDVIVECQLGRFHACLCLGEIVIAADLMQNFLSEFWPNEIDISEVFKIIDKISNEAVERLISVLEDSLSLSGAEFLSRLYFKQSRFAQSRDRLLGIQKTLLELSVEQKHILAACHLNIGDIDQGKILYRQLVDANPEDYHALLGLASCESLTDKVAAVRTCKYLLYKNKLFFPALYQLGVWLLDLGKFEEAQEYLERAIELNSNKGPVYFTLAEVLEKRGFFDEAVHALEHAFSIDKGLIGARIKLAQLYSDTDIKRSISIIDATLAIEGNENNVSLLQEKARYLHEIHDLDGALDAISLALPQAQNIAAMHSTNAVLLREKGRVEDSYAAIQKAESLAPHKLYIIVNKGAILSDLGRTQEALDMFNKALDIKPDDPSIRWYRCLNYLGNKMYQKGWLDYEARWHRPEILVRNFKFMQWAPDIEPCKTLVFSEQGLGDEIMFASCLKDFKQCATEVILECDPKLKYLFERSFPFAQVVANWDPKNTDWASEFGIDAQISCGSLPRYFRNSLGSFGEGEPYLYPDATKVSKWSNKLVRFEGKRLVGLSWRGGVYVTRTGLRSIPTQELGPLLNLPNTEFFSLQYGEVQEDLATIEQTFGVKIHHFQDMVDDYDETAAFLANMDVVVSVQTSLVHLCGALGVPVLCMLPKVPEWRYGYTGDSMPWYASVRLFRQQSSGDWSDVLENVCVAIEQEFS